MNTAPKPKIIAVVGPTASGKTALGVSLAKKFNGEIISADSRQIYKGLDLGTGKVTQREKNGIPHHLIDIASPRRTFTVAQYQRRGLRAIAAILAKKKIPIIVGGTGLYIDALLSRYAFPEIKPNLPLRAQLEKQSLEKLFARLQKLDPRRAASIDAKNKRRLIRAIEIATTLKKPMPAYEEIFERESNYNVLKIGINPPPEILKKKIAKRLAERMKKGMVAEVRRLHDSSGLSWQRLDNLGLEYRFIGRYLQGKLTRTEMIATLEREIYRYSRRQMTWFKKDKSILWIQNENQAISAAKKFLAI